MKIAITDPPPNIAPGMLAKVNIRIYEGVDHAFSNPSGTAYNAEAAADAWARTRAFLGDALR